MPTRICAGWLLVLLIVTGCGQTQSRVTAAAIPPGWQPMVQAGLTLALPPQWQVISAEQIDAPGALEGLADANPQFAPLVDRTRQLFADHRVRLLAYDLQSAQAGFASSVALGIVPAGDASLAQLRSANHTQLQQTPGFGNLNDSITRVAGHPAVRFGYTVELKNAGGKASALQIDQYLWVAAPTQYLLTFTTTPEQYHARAPVFQQILATMHVSGS